MTAAAVRPSARRGRPQPQSALDQVITYIDGHGRRHRLSKAQLDRDFYEQQGVKMEEPKPAPLTVVPNDRPKALAPMQPKQGAPVDVEALQMIGALAEQLMGSALLPRHCKSKADLVATMLVGWELGIPPMTAIRSLHIVEGKPQLDYSIMIAQLTRAGYEVQWKEGEGWVELHLKKGNRSHVERYSMADAEKARLTGKTNWKLYQKDMLRARATSRATRSFAAEVMSTCYVSGEISDSPDLNQEEAPLDEQHFAKTYGAEKGSEMHAHYTQQVELARDLLDQLELVDSVENFHQWAWANRTRLAGLTHADASRVLWDRMRELRRELVGDARPCPLTAATLQEWSRGQVEEPKAPSARARPFSMGAGTHAPEPSPASQEHALVAQWRTELEGIQHEGPFEEWCYRHGFEARGLKDTTARKALWAAVMGARVRINQKLGDKPMEIPEVKGWFENAREDQMAPWEVEEVDVDLAPPHLRD